MNNLNKKNFTCSGAYKFATKKTLLLLLICFVFSISAIHGNTKTITPITLGDKNKKASADTLEECLEIVGRFDDNAKEFTGFYNVKLILENTVVATQAMSVKKGFGFVLLKNKYYTIKIEKEGYIPRIFSISTKLTDKLDEKNSYIFSFETSLLSQDLYHLFNDDDMDFPFALINYNKTCDCFEHSKEYTASLIQRMINQLIYGS
ncbi:MAG TPA: hypothetical protein VN698_00450 [Bacteroidia bacterium]|nr:hypothetical protein [Bacteroidia bacterium]